MFTRPRALNSGRHRTQNGRCAPDPRRAGSVVWIVVLRAAALRRRGGGCRARARVRKGYTGQIGDDSSRLLADDAGAAAEAEAAGLAERGLQRRQAPTVLATQVYPVLVQEPDQIGRASCRERV